MKITIKIECDNAAFHEHGIEDGIDGREVARILYRYAGLCDGDNMRVGYFQPLSDINGNKVGSVKVSK